MMFRKPCLVVLVLGILPLSLTAQEEPDTLTKKLTLRPASPPAPVMKYELAVNFRNAVAANAAISYYRAMQLLSERRGHDDAARKAIGEMDRKIDEMLGKPIKDLPREELRKHLDSYRMVFREVELASKRTHCDWDLERRLDSDGIGVLLPEVQRMRELARMLKARCRLHMADGNLDAAIHDISIGLTMGRHVAEGPTLIQTLVGMAIIGIFSTELEELIQLPDAPNLYWALSTFPRQLVDFRRPLEGELRSLDASVPILKEVDRGPLTVEAAREKLQNARWIIEPDAPVSELAGGFLRTPTSQAMFVAMQFSRAKKSLLKMGRTEKEIDAMPAAQVVLLNSVLQYKIARDEMMVWLMLPYHEGKEGLRHGAQQLRKAREEMDGDIVGMMLLQLMPALEKVSFAVARTERNLACLRTIEAIRGHVALGNGTLPGKLSDIRKLPVPRDPMTGESFVYSVKDGKAILYAPPPEGEKAHQGNSRRFEITIVK